MAAVGSARERPRWWLMASGVVLGGAIAGLAVVGALGEMSGADHDGAPPATAGPVALSLPEGVPAEPIAFPEAGLPGWTSVAGRWAVEPMPDASGGGRALVQRAVDNAFNVIVAPGGPYTDVDVTVRFKPISGREDASGGIVFRFVDGRYYVVRANALEGNFRL